ncbi:MAG: glycosyltransferase, partial [Gaiellaceae bacterium]
MTQTVELSRKPLRAYRAARRLWERALAEGSGPGWIEAYEAAAAGLLDYLEIDPAEPLFLNALGVLLYELTLREAATSLFRAALSLDSALPAAEANLTAASVPADSVLERPALPALAARAGRVAGRARPVEGRRLSLCMVVRDEEELLPACLASAVDALDEIVVVDTGSTDATVEIAERFGARVIHAPWNDSFADARNAGLAQATGDWILMLDADERLGPRASATIRSLVGRSWREAFLFPITNLTGDGSTSTLHPALRLWRNRREYRFEGRVHEQIATHMPVDLPERFELVDVPILHEGYLSRLVAARGKAARNLALLELEAGERPGPYVAFNLGSEHLRLGDWQHASEYLDNAWLAICGQPDWSTIGFAPLLAVRAARARRELGRLEAARGLLRF